MKIQHLVALFAAAVTFTACDDTTDTIGASLSNLTDAVEVGTASFDIPSNSILADSVLSNSLTGYIGKVRDPETGAYITGDFMAQFTCLEDYQFPDKTISMAAMPMANLRPDLSMPTPASFACSTEASTATLHAP